MVKIRLYNNNNNDENDTFFKSKEVKNNKNVETGITYDIGIKLVKY